jgi:8-oxo-dGTP pyrophosphatase MutT (NUDIX family)
MVVKSYGCIILSKIDGKLSALCIKNSISYNLFNLFISIDKKNYYDAKMALNQLPYDEYELLLKDDEMRSLYLKLFKVKISDDLLRTMRDFVNRNPKDISNETILTWSFPKGKKEGLETGWEAAVRETEEETGLKEDDYCKIEEKPIKIEYTGSDRIQYKLILYMVIKRNNVKLKKHPNLEVSYMRWIRCDLLPKILPRDYNYIFSIKFTESLKKMMHFKLLNGRECYENVEFSEIWQPAKSKAGPISIYPRYIIAEGASSFRYPLCSID